MFGRAKAPKRPDQRSRGPTQSRLKSFRWSAGRPDYRSRVFAKDVEFGFFDYAWREDIVAGVGRVIGTFDGSGLLIIRCL